MNLDSVEEILDFAIRAEEKAHDFYTHLAGRVFLRERPQEQMSLRQFELQSD